LNQTLFQIPIVHLLVKKGVDKEAVNDSGKKPVDLAKHAGLKQAIIGKYLPVFHQCNKLIMFSNVNSFEFFGSLLYRCKTVKNSFGTGT
jgi:hypothetical protein